MRRFIRMSFPTSDQLLRRYRFMMMVFVASNLHGITRSSSASASLSLNSPTYDPYAFAAGSASPSSSSSFTSLSFSSLPEKRADRLQYNFGLGKRESKPNVNDGINEIRDNRSESSTRSNSFYVLYPFEGLDSDSEYLEKMELNTLPVSSHYTSTILEPLLAIKSKRDRPQRFSFGLGKRMDRLSTRLDDWNGALNEIVTDKRKVQPYRFGLGRRSTNGYGNKIKKLSNFEDFIKRRYSFGLGKRSNL
ncbi:Cuticle protein 6 [Sarcoptes scabiei]|nr:Cuticle protein 6 [Sarcoptes scabiei]